MMDPQTHYLQRDGKALPIPKHWLQQKPDDVLCTIVIPCYNYGNYLPEAVTSALGQTLYSLEVIIVDDGSTDPYTKEVVASYADTPRVKIISQKNAGLSAARNAGIKAAKSKYICCLDADDWLSADYIEQCIWRLESDQNVGFVYSWVRVFGDDNHIWHTRDFDIDEARDKNWTSVAAVYPKCDWFLAGGYDTSMAGGYEDWEFWLRLSQLGRAGKVIKAPLFHHRRHGVTMTHTAKAMDKELTSRMRSLNPAFYSDKRWQQTLKEQIGAPSSFQSPGKLIIAQRAKRQEKPGLLVVLPWLQPGGAEIIMLDILRGLSLDFSLTILTTMQDEHVLEPQFAALTSDIFHFEQEANTEHFAAFITYLMATRGIETVFSSGSQRLYQALSMLKAEHLKLRVFDLLHNDSELGHAPAAIAQTPFIDGHIAVSARITETLAMAGIAYKKLHVIFNGIDSARLFRPQPEARAKIRAKLGIPEHCRVLGFVGRASSEKRPLLFFDLLKRLRSKMDVFGLFVGAGPMQADIADYIHALGLSRHVRSIDKLPREQLAEIYEACDLLINVSDVEGMPLTVLEAQATGCPVAAMHVGQLEKIIADGENGILLEENDFEHLADRVAALLPDSEKLAVMRVNAREWFTRSGYDLETMVSNYRQLLASFAQAQPVGKEMLIANLVRIDVFGSLGDVSYVLPPIEIKLIWNLFLRMKYEEAPLPLSRHEITELFALDEARGFPVPHFIAIIDRLMTKRFFDKAYEFRTFADASFELYLIDYILYAREVLAHEADFARETWEWMVAPWDKASMPKLLAAIYMNAGDLRRQFDITTEHGYLGVVGWFCLWKKNAITGYRHPSWFEALLGEPANVPKAKEEGITQLLVAIRASVPHLMEQFSLVTSEGRKAWLGWCAMHKLTNLPHYQHPQWLAALLDVPSPNVPDAEKDGISYLLEALHYAAPEYSAPFDLATREGRKGWLGFFCHWRMAKYKGYKHPEWLARLLDKPADAIVDAERIGISRLMEALWYSDPAIQESCKLDSTQDLEAFFVWFTRYKAPALPDYAHPEWIKQMITARETQAESMAKEQAHGG